LARQLVKTRAAEADLIGIWTYSFSTWNEAQADRYLGALEHGIARLTEDPTSGSPRDELREGYWSKRLERHVVFYTFTDSALRVCRVLHAAMDMDRHL